MPSGTVLVTGATGFIGSHIVQQLLASGYKVNAIARGPKGDNLKHALIQYGDALKIVNVNHLATADLSEGMDGVTAVIHTAFGTLDAPNTFLKTAEDAIDNVVKYVLKSGSIKKIIMTGSMITFGPAKDTYDIEEWNPITSGQATGDNAYAAFAGAKVFSEQKLWNYAQQHDTLDITSISPPFVYGPFGPGFSLPDGDVNQLGTNIFIYKLLRPDGATPMIPRYCDVRDVARAHIGALSQPQTDFKKRIAIASPYSAEFTSFNAVVGEARPELKDRLTTRPYPAEDARIQNGYDWERIEKATGLKQGEMKTFKQTMLDTVDDILRIEKECAALGKPLDCRQALY